MSWWGTTSYLFLLWFSKKVFASKMKKRRSVAWGGSYLFLLSFQKMKGFSCQKNEKERSVGLGGSYLISFLKKNWRVFLDKTWRKEDSWVGVDQGTICSCQASRPPATPPPIRPRIEATRGQNLEDINTNCKYWYCHCQLSLPLWPSPRWLPILLTIGHSWPFVGQRSFRICSLREWGCFLLAILHVAASLYSFIFLTIDGIAGFLCSSGDIFQEGRKKGKYISFSDTASPHFMASNTNNILFGNGAIAIAEESHIQGEFSFYTHPITHTHIICWASLNADQNCFF